MAGFDIRRAQEFQNYILDRVRSVQRNIDTDVTAYYRKDRVDDERDYYENLRGLYRYLRNAHQSIGEILNEIGRRI